MRHSLRGHGGQGAGGILGGHWELGDHGFMLGRGDGAGFHEELEVLWIVRVPS